MDEITTSSDLTPSETTDVAEIDSSVQAETPEVTQTDAEPVTTDESPFNPDSIPEELKPAYKSMQADYTKKTQAIAEERKQVETLKQQAETFKKYEQYVPILEEMFSNSTQAVKESPEMVALEKDLRAQGYGDDAVDLMKKTSQFLINQFNQKEQVQQQERAQQEQQVKLSQSIAEAEKLDPRLTDSELVYQTGDGESFTFGQMVSDLVASTPDWQTNTVEATRKAIKRVDSLIGVAKTQGKEELSTLAKTKANKFPNANSSPASASSDDAPKTIQEAAKLAKTQLGY